MSSARAGLCSKSKIGSILVILTSLACPVPKADAAGLPQKIVTVEGITEYRLDNGLRLLLFPDPSASTVTVNLTVFVGSRHEGYGETGMAHLLEHMLFKGTTKRRDIPKSLKERGAQYNATTSLDRTNFFETLAGTDDNLEFALGLEADRMVNSLIRREDLLSEMTVVRSEFEQGENSPQAVLDQRMLAAAYEWHNYGKSTIGNRSDIERVPIERLQAFYRKYYRPDNAMLAIAGKFQVDRALSLVASEFGVLKNPAVPLDRTYTEEPPQDGEREVLLRRVGKVGYVGAVYHIPAGGQEDYPAIEVLNHVLVSEPSGRLYKALVESKKAASVFGNARGCHDPGYIEFIAEVEPQLSPDAVRGTMVDVLEKLTSQPVRSDEVERAKQEMLAQRELLMSRSNVVGRLVSEWAAMGDWRLFFLNRDRLAQVTPADVNRVATQYLVRSNRTIGVFIPTSGPQRAAIPVAKSLEDRLRNYKGKAEVALGEAFEPTPENIEKRVKRSQVPGGLKVAFLPKKTRAEMVYGMLNLHYGSEETLRGHTSATQFIASMLERGTAKHDRQEITDELNRLQARYRASGQLGDASFAFEVKRSNLPSLLNLVAEMLRQPSFPPAEFDVLKRETRARLHADSAQPASLAIRDLQRRLNPFPPDNVRYVPAIEESIKRLDRVTVEEVHQIYQQKWGAQAAELALVGDFESGATGALVQKLLGDWKAPTPFHRIERPAPKDIAAGRHVIITPDKANAVYLAGELAGLRDTDSDYAALEVANFALGGGSLSSRLGNRVRQKEGLSYTVLSQFSASSKDPAARFIVFAISNPANMEKLDRIIAEELNRFMKEGLGEKELTEAAKAYLQELRLRRANDSAIASMLAEELFNERTFTYYMDLEQKIGKLSVDEVNAALRRHLQPGRLIVIHAGDFKNQARSQP
jgi:zinc protease